MGDDGVLAEALEIIEIAEVAAFLRAGEAGPFSERELHYAQSKVDPERRLAARLAAKRAACRLLGPTIGLAEVEILRGPGAPTLRLSANALARLAGLGGVRALVSLTHERKHAAASVLLLGEERSSTGPPLAGPE